MALDDTSLDDVRDTFAFLDDWEERYKFIIDLGRKLDPLPDSDMVDANKVRGCQSQVWLVPEKDAEGHIHLRGDSDAHIVKGLVALMLLTFSGKTGREIVETDAEGLMAELGLRDHLSPMRANGLYAMLERIREIGRMAA
ncbi:SufE family protein [Yunchengibacter salinarum]|uniref:SufE family protein n=1 Tax=Yunchengibacter salinarum TaxID=3133399 RepID=UPI0035B67AEE